MEVVTLTTVTFLAVIKPIHIASSAAGISGMARTVNSGRTMGLFLEF